MSLILSESYRQFSKRHIEKVLQEVYALEPRFALALAQIVYVDPSLTSVLAICAERCRKPKRVRINLRSKKS